MFFAKHNLKNVHNKITKLFSISFLNAFDCNEITYHVISSLAFR